MDDVLGALLLALCASTLPCILDASSHPIIEASPYHRYHRGCPRVCTCHLEIAYCDNLHLKRIPTFPNKADGLTIVNIRGNEIARLRRRHLVPLKGIEHLLFRGNEISRIQSGTFVDMLSLVSLSLTNNRIARLPWDAFSGLRGLRVLSLRSNQLERLRRLLSPLASLQLLNLSHNRLQRITRRTFAVNPRLIVLDLQANQITRLSPRSFSNLLYLRVLLLQDNPLVAVTFRFGAVGGGRLDLLSLNRCKLTRVARGLPRYIRDLRLAGNNISGIMRTDFSHTRNVRVLDLNHNGLAWIEPGALTRLTHLHSLYVGGNRLRRLPHHLPRGLRRLHANDNRINTVQMEAFPLATRLEFLHLRHNAITTVAPSVFVTLNQLRSLDLSHNALNSVPSEAFAGLSSLERLDISFNPIGRLSERGLDGLRSLRILQAASLGGPDLVAPLPGLLTELLSLRFLDLSNASRLVRSVLAKLPRELPVQDLNLMANDLHSLLPEFRRSFAKLRVVKLAGNPWHCDRDLYWLRTWMHNGSVVFHAPNHMRCATPAKLQGRLISELHPDDWQAVPSRKKLPNYTVKHRVNGTSIWTVHGGGVRKVPLARHKVMQSEKFDLREIKRNSGARNSGARNSGAKNSGARNSVARNSGARNSAARNSVARNSVARNSVARNGVARNGVARNSIESLDYSSGNLMEEKREQSSNDDHRQKNSANTQHSP